MTLNEKLQKEADEQCARWGFEDENSKQLVLNLILRGALIAGRELADRACQCDESELDDDNPLFIHHNSALGG